MIYFRHHRGALIDALKTEKKFNNINDLFNYLGNNDYTIKYYCYDKRNNIGDTFIIVDNKHNMPIGFLYLKN